MGDKGTEVQRTDKTSDVLANVHPRWQLTPSDSTVQHSLIGRVSTPPEVLRHGLDLAVIETTRVAHLVTAIINPHRLSEVHAAIRSAGAIGLTVTEVHGYGRQGGKTGTFRGTEYTIDFVPKVKVEVIIEDNAVDTTIDAITNAARTGKIGDGKIWALPLDRLLRIRTGETGDYAL